MPADQAPDGPAPAPAPGPVLARVRGHRMLLHHPSLDLYISRALLARGSFEPFETEILLDELRGGDTVLDIGANVGYYTLQFANRVGPGGRVFAFEPDPANFALLRSNVERNGYRNVALSPLAAADRCGPGKLFISATNRGDHRAYDSHDGRPSVTIRTTTLDHFFRGYGGPINLIKMDIQGAECSALEGMRGLLGRQNRVKMTTEFWPRAARGRCQRDPILGNTGRAGLSLICNQ
jgi:FkbM family methyltransferase